MGFRINTNISAMNAINQSNKTSLNLNSSLQKLSSGLRINTAADDSSGLAIADSLNQQAKGLDQAINNANDGIGVVQTADGALEEYTNIINTIRTKAIQAASDGQSAQSREAIQNDVSKLLEEAQNIASTTSFNGQNLLNGSYANKSYHIGAYAGETVNISIGDTQTDKVGTFAMSEGIGVTAISVSSDGSLYKVSGTALTDETITFTASISGTLANGQRGTISATFVLNSATLKSNDGMSSYDIARKMVDAINEEADTKGMDIRASVYEAASSTPEAPKYGIRLDSHDDIGIVGTDVHVVASAAKLGDHSLADIDVRTREGAQKAVIITDYALQELDATRSQIGSVQNQLESTIRNISVTQVNVTAAESQIRDVDFAAESAEFSKQSILAQSGTYALSQANSVQENVTRLLQ